VDHGEPVFSSLVIQTTGILVLPDLGPVLDHFGAISPVHHKEMLKGDGFAGVLNQFDELLRLGLLGNL
jgi:hypothetical protein